MPLRSPSPPDPDEQAVESALSQPAPAPAPRRVKQQQRLTIVPPPIPPDDALYTRCFPAPLTMKKKEVVSASDEEENEEEEDELAGAGEGGEPAEVLGEERGIYAVRMSGGWADKMSKDELDAYPVLLKTFERKRASNTLRPFSFSSNLLRPSPYASPAPPAPASARASRSRPTRIEDSESEDELAAASVDEGSYEDSDAQENPRRSSRTRTTTPANRPRQREAYSSPSSGSGSDSTADAAPSARTTRAPRVARRARASSSARPSSSDESEGSSPEHSPPRRSRARARAHRAPSSSRSPSPSPSSDPLLAHRSTCERCGFLPASEELAKVLASKKRRRGRPRKSGGVGEDGDETSDDEERLRGLGGWVECTRCCVAAHLGCLAKSQQEEVVRRVRREEEQERMELDGEGKKGEEERERPRRKTIEVDEVVGFLCGNCVRETAAEEEKKPEEKPGAAGDVEMEDRDAAPAPAEQKPTEILFRCSKCKRASSYSALPPPDSEANLRGTAAWYHQDWQCLDCDRWSSLTIEHILAWRPAPGAPPERPLPEGEYHSPGERLAREYLVKWRGVAWRELEWVPHEYISATSQTGKGKLRNFLERGCRVELLAPGESSRAPTPLTAAPSPSRASTPLAQLKEIDASSPSNRRLPPTPSAAAQRAAATAPPGGPLDADPLAEQRVPEAWQTVDRVLDVYFRLRKAGKGKGKARRGVVESESEESAEEGESEEEEEVPEEERVHIEERERKLRRSVGEESVRDVCWAYVKWGDLPYEQATWTLPPSRSDSLYPAFQRAYARFLAARRVSVPPQTAREAARKARRGKAFKELDGQPKCVEGGELKGYQVDGLNWLLYNWWKEHPAILADEMGLGKTVQIVSLVATLADKFKSFPSLIVVPNSTISNWLREFEKWAPALTVVPFYGEAASRNIIKEYELFHSGGAHPSRGGGGRGGWQPKTGLRAHVVLATYESLIGKNDFGLFRTAGRWELLVVDEGQRLKGDDSKLLNRLNELDIGQRVLLTGTPLNNNIRELINLLAFLDPDEWPDVDEAEAKYADLTKELVDELHGKLKPYFLRRTKKEVLTLLPKNEIYVPLTMTRLQREAYKGLLQGNVQVLQFLTRSTNGATRGAGDKGAPPPKGSSTSLNNVLMQMRKVIQHPYLVNEALEPEGLSDDEMHRSHVEASAKLVWLQTMLPKLKERGHRVLLFSQFKIALDEIERFLIHEGYKYARLDGNTPQAQRQKDVDAFNAPDSELFIFILTTRAGGVGINLTGADTVVMFDPDFNPHQDLQAISRAHRFGQTKKVLVFKLMARGSCEEKIIQSGKKKLALDHVIVQNMDTAENENVESILTYGARELFESEQDETSEIRYTADDCVQMIEKLEKEEGPEEDEGEGGMSFGFARVWEGGKDGNIVELEEGPEGEAGADATSADFWEKMLRESERVAAEEKAREEANLGRGTKRKRAGAVNYAEVIARPAKEDEAAAGRKKSKKKADNSGDEYRGPGDDESESDVVPNEMRGTPPLEPSKTKRKRKRAYELTDKQRAAPAFLMPQPSEGPVMDLWATREFEHLSFPARREAVRALGQALGMDGVIAPLVDAGEDNPDNFMYALERVNAQLKTNPKWFHWFVDRVRKEAPYLAQPRDENVCPLCLFNHPLDPCFHLTDAAQIAALVQRIKESDEPAKDKDKALSALQIRYNEVIAARLASGFQQPNRAYPPHPYPPYPPTNDCDAIAGALAPVASTSKAPAEAIACLCCGGPKHLSIDDCPVLLEGYPRVKSRLTEMRAQPLTTPMRAAVAELDAVRQRMRAERKTAREHQPQPQPRPLCSLCGEPRTHTVVDCPLYHSGPQAVQARLDALFRAEEDEPTQRLLRGLLEGGYVWRPAADGSSATGSGAPAGQGASPSAPSAPAGASPSTSVVPASAPHPAPAPTATSISAAPASVPAPARPFTSTSAGSPPAVAPASAPVPALAPKPEPSRRLSFKGKGTSAEPIEIDDSD